MISPCKQPNRESADNDPGGLMYRFLQCTAGQYMTRDVTAVTRDATLRSLAMLPVARSSREGRVGIAAVAEPRGETCLRRSASGRRPARS